MYLVTGVYIMIPHLSAAIGFKKAFEIGNVSYCSFYKIKLQNEITE